MFQWQDSAILRRIKPNDNEVSPTPPIILNDIRYIADVDCESTLTTLQQVLNGGHGFCIHSPKFQPHDVVSVDAIEKPLAHNAKKDVLIPQNTMGLFECLTSGTNGQPKRVQRTPASWMASFQVNANLAQIDANDRYAIIGRLSHSLSLYATLEAAHLGADIHPLTEQRPKKQLQAIVNLRSTVLYATPTQLRLLCGSVREHELLSLKQSLCVRAIFCGGGKLDSRTRKQVTDVFQFATIREFYGASETSFITMSDEQTPTGSVGKAYPGVEILIEESSGEIWVKSPYVFQSYANTTKHAAQWKNGYISVGEIGYLDSAGYLFLAGRQSRRVNIADTLVYPEELENMLNEHAAVKHGAVIAIADDQRGHVLIAAVEPAIDKHEDPDAGARTLANDKLKQTLMTSMRQQVGNLKAPRDIIFMTNLPLLISGKPDLILIEQTISDAVKLNYE